MCLNLYPCVIKYHYLIHIADQLQYIKDYCQLLTCDDDDDDDDDDGDEGLNVLGCRVDILGKNCNKLLKLRIIWGRGGMLQLQYV